jgi:hypothetical protein
MNPNSIEQQDITAVRRLTDAMMAALHEHYSSKLPLSPANIYEALNALAVCTAIIVASVRSDGGDESALDFFGTALTDNLNSDLLKRTTQ